MIGAKESKYKVVNVNRGCILIYIFFFPDICFRLAYYTSLKWLICISALMRGNRQQAAGCNNDGKAKYNLTIHLCALRQQDILSSRTHAIFMVSYFSRHMHFLRSAV